MATPRFTEKHMPCAYWEQRQIYTTWLSSWYGSCPIITTFTFSHWQCVNALNTSCLGGKIFCPLFSSACRNFCA